MIATAKNKQKETKQKAQNNHIMTKFYARAKNESTSYPTYFESMQVKIQLNKQDEEDGKKLLEVSNKSQRRVVSVGPAKNTTFKVSGLNSKGRGKSASRTRSKKYIIESSSQESDGHHSSDMEVEPPASDTAAPPEKETIIRNKEEKLLRVAKLYKEIKETIRTLLDAGFNIHFYGIGSKLEFMKKIEYAMFMDCPTITVNGFHSSINIKTLLNTCCSIVE